jgi:NADPH-dependent 2,4-dienoyl-CoA reductase/sulfur reductase-like enzyme
MIARLAAVVLTTALLFCVVPHADAAQSPAVLVVGGTPAGVAAAVSAARDGADVVLVARRPVLGGILADAMMDQWDLNVAPDGSPIQGGLFTEIHARLGDAFTPAEAARVFGDLVAKEPKIHVVTGARPVAVQTSTTPDGRAITTIRFKGTGGEPIALAARTVVDATDDGDVAALAGARYDVGRQDTGLDERMQPVTLMFTLRGVAWRRVVSSYDVERDGAGGAGERRAWGYAKLVRAYTPSSADVVVRDLNFGRESDAEVTVNAIDVLGIDGRSDADLARARATAERETPRLIAFLRDRVPGFERASLGRYADALYVRETRHFAGL